MYKSKISFYLIMFITILTFSITLLVSFSTKSNSFINDDPESSTEESIEIPENIISISYSTNSLTNENVSATFNTNNENIIITNNDGNDTYIFEDNGKFIFQYMNTITKESGSIEAKVDWIDKTAPTATILYDVTTKTNGRVKALLVPSEEITILNNHYDLTGNPYEYTFENNGEFTFEFIDKAGNKGYTTAIVDWIDNTLPIATITYDLTSKTKSPVTAKITFNKENIAILNNDGKDFYTFNTNGTFIFEYKDEFGNIGSKLAEVTWIEKNITKKTQTNIKSNDNFQEINKEIIYKMFSTENLEYEIDSSLIKNNFYLKKNSLTLTPTLEKIFDKDNDYFEFYFTDENNKKIDSKEYSNSVLTIMLNGTKKFIKIYSISEDDKIQELDYKIVNGNKLEIKNAQPGKYLVEYEKTTSNDNYIEVNSNTKNDENFNTIIITSSCIIGLAIIVIIIYAVVKSY